MLPALLATLQGMMLALAAMPTEPMVLSTEAATPAQAVPWPAPLASSWGLASLSPKS
jgi:hypothetical protein